jgi:hypothetical protein
VTLRRLFRNESGRKRFGSGVARTGAVAQRARGLRVCGCAAIPILQLQGSVPGACSVCAGSGMKGLPGCLPVLCSAVVWCGAVCADRSFKMPQEESVLLNLNERYERAAPEDTQVKRRNARIMFAFLSLAVVAVVAIVALTAQAGQRIELAEDVAKRLGYSLARKPRQFTMLDGEPVVAPVPAISAVAGAHAASRGAAGEANALEGQISDLKKEIQAIANTKELEAKLQAKIAQDRRNDEADVAHELALQKTLAELKLLAKEKFDQINMDKEKEGGLTAEEAAQLDQQILALENSLKVPFVSQ